MNACISVVCYKSKTLSNGENPLMLQVSKGGKRKYQSLGISILPRYWDFTRNKRRTRQTLWRAVQMLTQKLCCQTIHDCPKVVPLHYESE